jgi:chemotaxis protein histidine kinase CheA
LSDSDPEAPGGRRLKIQSQAPNPGGGGNAGRAPGPSIRVAAEKLDQLVNLVGELVTVQARLSEISARRDDPDILAVSEEVDRLTAELRETR